MSQSVQKMLCVLHSWGALSSLLQHAFGYLQTLASVCEAVLPGSGRLDRKVIPLCKVHHSHLYK